MVTNPDHKVQAAYFQKHFEEILDDIHKTRFQLFSKDGLKNTRDYGSKAEFCDAGEIYIKPTKEESGKYVTYYVSFALDRIYHETDDLQAKEGSNSGSSELPAG